MGCSLDCEQSLSFPSVFRAIERRANERAVSGEPASPHSLLVSFPNLHNINKSSARGGFREQKPTTRSLGAVLKHHFHKSRHT